MPFTSPDPRPYLSRVDRYRTNLLQLPLFVANTALWGTLSLLASTFDTSGSLQHRIAQIWATLSVLISGSHITVINAENLHKCPVAVYASNHTSYMDTPVLFSSLDFQFRILAKKELWKIPFIGWYLSRSGQLPIDTANPRATLSSLSQAAKTLAAGMPVFVFPEGGRTPDGKLKTFQNGAAYLAIRAQVPIVPITLRGVYDVLPMHTRHFHPSRIEVVVGTPIPTEGLNVRQSDALTAQLKDAIEQNERAEPSGTSS